MDFSKVATDTAESMDALVKFILSLDISPDDKKARIARAFRIVGTEFYTKLYGATSAVLDSMAISTLVNLDYNQIDRLADKLIQNYVLGREIDYLVKDYYDSELGRAQNEAFQNAISLDKHPTLERIIVGETCGWCIDKAGVHLYPSGEDFARHRDCDCIFKVSGYNTRNGILKNYVKEKK